MEKGSVGFEDLLEEVCGVGILGVLGWLRVWERRVFGVGVDDVLGWMKLANVSRLPKSDGPTLWDIDNEPLPQKPHT